MGSLDMDDGFLVGRRLVYGWTTALPSMLTAVWASSRPLMEAPVRSAIEVCVRMTPSKCAVVPISTSPATSQKTFCGTAPPLSKTLVALATVSPCAIWKIQTSVRCPGASRLSG